MSQQPSWILAAFGNTDCARLYTDETGVYAPELERAESIDDEDYVPDDYVRGHVCDECNKPCVGTWHVGDESGAADHPADPTDAELPTFYLLWRFSLDKLTIGADGYLVDCVDAQGAEHAPWFENDKHVCLFCNGKEGFCGVAGHYVSHNLSSAASAMGMDVSALRALFCHDDPAQRSVAYEAVAGTCGYDNFDSYPLTLTEEELDERWTEKVTVES